MQYEHGRWTMQVNFSWRSWRGEVILETEAAERIVHTGTLQACSVRVWTGFNRLMIASLDKFLWLWYWTFRFHKIWRRGYRPNEWLSASEGGCCSIRLVGLKIKYWAFIARVSGLTQSRSAMNICACCPHRSQPARQLFCRIGEYYTPTSIIISSSILLAYRQYQPSCHWE